MRSQGATWHVLLRPLLILFCLIASLAIASEEAVLAKLKPVADGLLSGDFTPGITIMYEPVVNDLGGKKKLLEAVAALKDQMAALKMKVVRSDFVRPFRFVRGEKRHYVIVSSVTDFEAPVGLIRVQGFQLGIEVSPGEWQFVDGAHITPAVVEKYFPDFPSTEKLPEQRQDVIKKN